jgi:hypothetical protein
MRLKALLDGVVSPNGAPPLIFIGVYQQCLGQPWGGRRRCHVQEVSQRPWSWFGRTSQATNRSKLPLKGWQVDPGDFHVGLGAVLRRLLALVGPLIHARLNSALWLVDAFCLGLRGVFTCSWGVFSPLIELHINIHQHLWKWLVMILIFLMFTQELTV